MIFLNQRINNKNNKYDALEKSLLSVSNKFTYLLHTHTMNELNKAQKSGKKKYTLFNIWVVKWKSNILPLKKQRLFTSTSSCSTSRNLSKIFSDNKNKVSKSLINEYYIKMLPKNTFTYFLILAQLAKDLDLPEILYSGKNIAVLHQLLFKKIFEITHENPNKSVSMTKFGVFKLGYKYKKSPKQQQLGYIQFTLKK